MTINIDILKEGFKNDNWEPLKMALRDKTVTVKDLNEPVNGSDIKEWDSAVDGEKLEEEKVNVAAIAAMKGRVDILELLFDYGLTMSSENNAALLYAADFQQTEVVKFLLAKGANVNFQDDEGMTALEYVLNYTLNIDERGNNPIPTITVLLENGADPYVTRDHKEWILLPLLDNAIHKTNTNIISLLIDPRFPINRTADALKKRSDAFIRTIKARPNDDYENIALALLPHIDMKSMGSEGLLEAAAIGNLSLVGALVDRGSDVNCVKGSIRISTPLMEAIRGDLQVLTCYTESLSSWQVENMARLRAPGPHYAVIELLLQRGAVPDYPIGVENAMTLANATGDQKLIKLLRSSTNKMPKTSTSSPVYFPSASSSSNASNASTTPHAYGLVLGEKNLEKRIIKNREDVIAVLKKLVVRKNDGNELPPPEIAFRRAAFTGMIKEMKILLENVPDLDMNEVGASKKTALDYGNEFIENKDNKPTDIDSMRQYIGSLIELGAKRECDLKEKVTL